MKETIGEMHMLKRIQATDWMEENLSAIPKEWSEPDVSRENMAHKDD